MNRNVYIALQIFADPDPRPVRILEGAGFSIRRNTLGRRLRREELPGLLREADAVLAGVEPYDAEVLNALPRLRCISRCGIGTDAIDLQAARERNVAVLTTPDEVVEPVAEMSVAMILALARNFSLHLRDFDRGQWQKRTGFLLSEWTVGLIGFGRIGRAVERILRVFRPAVLISDPAVEAKEVPPPATLCDLSALLAESDLISLHAGRRQSEGPLLGPEEFRRMKPGSRLVNTARGHLVNEQALLQALQSGHLAGAALDVFAEEPTTGPLGRLPNVLCTPHVATLTRASRAAMERRSAQNVVDFFSGGGR